MEFLDPDVEFVDCGSALAENLWFMETLDHDGGNASTQISPELVGVGCSYYYHRQIVSGPGTQQRPLARGDNTDDGGAFYVEQNLGQECRKRFAEHSGFGQVVVRSLSNYGVDPLHNA